MSNVHRREAGNKAQRGNTPAPQLRRTETAPSLRRQGMQRLRSRSAARVGPTPAGRLLPRSPPPRFLRAAGRAEEARGGAGSAPSRLSADPAQHPPPGREGAAAPCCWPGGCRRHLSWGPPPTPGALTRVRPSRSGRCGPSVRLPRSSGAGEQGWRCPAGAAINRRLPAGRGAHARLPRSRLGSVVRSGERRPRGGWTPLPPGCHPGLPTLRCRCPRPESES